MRSDLAEVRVSAAWHHFVYREDERALAVLAGVRRSLANNAEAILLKAFIGRRQGRWEEAIVEMRRALSLDPRNQAILGALFDSNYWFRRGTRLRQATPFAGILSRAGREAIARRMPSIH